jgi:hypothetical protein
MFILRNPEILSKAVKGLCVAGLCVAGLCVALDTNHGRPYSVPFRTKESEFDKATSRWFCRGGGVARPLAVKVV